MDRAELEGLDRERLVGLAEKAGVRRARILTRPELVDELLRMDPAQDRAKLERSRGFFGRARDLLARVVERGLHLPDAAEKLREIALGDPRPSSVPRMDSQAVPTVTLAEIYAAQGHKQRAIDTLRRVLEREPDHEAARRLLAKLEDKAYVAPEPPLPPEDDISEAETLEGGASVVADPDAETLEVDVPSVGLPPPPKDIPISSPEPPVVPPANECIAVPIGPGAHVVWWRTSRHVRDLIIRAVVIVPTWDGPRKEIRDLDVEAGEGALVLRDLPEPCVLRVALGTLDGKRFVPLAHSPALEPGRRGGVTRWTMRGPVPIAADDPRAAAIARAIDAARRM